METLQELARQHKWHTEGGESFHEIACEHLRRIYTAIAEEVRLHWVYKIFIYGTVYLMFVQAHAEDPETSISYLKKALEAAKEGN